MAGERLDAVTLLQSNALAKAYTLLLTLNPLARTVGSGDKAYFNTIRPTLTKDYVKAMETQFGAIKDAYNKAKTIRNQVRSELVDTTTGTRLFEQHEQ